MKFSKKIMFFLVAFTICTNMAKAQQNSYKCLYLERLGISNSKDSARYWEPVSTVLPKGGFKSMGNEGIGVDSLINFLNSEGIVLNTTAVTRFKNSQTGASFLQLPFEQGELIVVNSDKVVTEYFLVVNDKDGKLTLNSNALAKSNCSSWALFQTYVTCGTSIACSITKFNPKARLLKLRYKRTCSGTARFYIVTMLLNCGCN